VTDLIAFAEPKSTYHQGLTDFTVAEHVLSLSSIASLGNQLLAEKFDD